jgi:hypothetical protein
MKNRCFAALSIFNVVFILAQVATIWIWHVAAIENFKNIYSSLGYNLTSFTLIVVASWENNWEWWWAVPGACFAHYLVTLYMRRDSPLPVFLSALTSLIVFLSMWYALIDPIMKAAI